MSKQKKSCGCGCFPMKNKEIKTIPVKSDKKNKQATKKSK